MKKRCRRLYFYQIIQAIDIVLALYRFYFEIHLNDVYIANALNLLFSYTIDSADHEIKTLAMTTLC